ncbi:MAG: hypothetical protein OSA99_00165 [Acidimicrobiales bacterium]|nr:hypothetical protein [Acidimicrobiales bacterium]
MWIEEEPIYTGHNDGRGRFSETPPHAVVAGEPASDSPIRLLDVLQQMGAEYE